MLDFLNTLNCSANSISEPKIWRIFIWTSSHNLALFRKLHLKMPIFVEDLSVNSFSLVLTLKVWSVCEQSRHMHKHAGGTSSTDKGQTQTKLEVVHVIILAPMGLDSLGNLLNLDSMNVLQNSSHSLLSKNIFLNIELQACPIQL